MYCTVDSNSVACTKQDAVADGLLQQFEFWYESWTSEQIGLENPQLSGMIESIVLFII